MNLKKILLTAFLISFMGLLFISPAGAKMVKEVCVGVFENAPSQADCDRFYMRYHGAEIARLAGPWMTRYQLWLPYEPPKEAVERFGAVRGRYAELWYHEEELDDLPAMRGTMEIPWPMSESKQANINVPSNPTDVFYDSDPHPEKTTILRWVTIIAYPEGVSLEDGENWFLNVYAKEAVKQPGLLKFVSHKARSNDSANPAPSDENKPQQQGDKADPSDQKSDAPPQMPRMKSWVRVCEYWYKDFDAWRKAVLESPPKYTAPPWGGKYPFVEMRSTFIPYYNDVDFLKGTYTVNFDMPNVKYNTTP